ncbi:hypothetical protein ACTXT7_002454 [Hymenolepis weldensis]
MHKANSNLALRHIVKEESYHQISLPLTCIQHRGTIWAFALNSTSTMDWTALWTIQFNLSYNSFKES